MLVGGAYINQTPDEVGHMGGKGLLTCLYNGEFFDNAQKGYTEVEKRLMGKDRKLICPICGNALYYNSRGKVVSHFSHYPGTACNESLLKDYDLDDEKHDMVKEIFARWLRNRFPDARVVKDRYFPGMRLICDVYFEFDRLRIAFELQFRHLTPEKLVERRSAYKDAGIKDIWIFIREGVIDPGSPYEREYYHSNNRELYYYDMETELFTYYKGLKSEKFDMACTRLENYICRSCRLGSIWVGNDGGLELPDWKESYIKRIGELRDRLHEKAYKKRSFNDEVQKRLANKLNYRAMHPDTGEAGDVPLSPMKAKGKPKTPKAAQVKENQKEYEFEKAFFSNEGSRKFIFITYKDTGREARYEIKSEFENENFRFYICKCTINFDKSVTGKGYIMKVYKNRNVLILEDWF